MAGRSITTLKDVAKAAGVSTVVASAVVNGARTSARVSAATRARVLAVARTLRYVPNAAAQSLTRPGMNMLGVAFNRTEFTFLSNSYVAPLMEGILATATARHFTVALFPTPWVNVHESAAPYGNGRTDGLIVIAPYLDSDMVPELVAMGLPMVLVAAPGETWGVPAVGVDNVRGGRLAAEHLLALGHRRFGLVAGAEPVADARERQAGFLDTLEKAGADVPDGCMVSGNFNAAEGYDAARTILSRPDPPTALFAANDHSAVGAARAAEDLGLRVPDQVSVVGFDDAPVASSGAVPLTTVGYPLARIGQHAAELLLALVAGETVPAITHRHPPELIVRASTGPPPLAP